MKKVILLLAISLCAMVAKAQDKTATDTDKIVCKYVINGHFFKEIDQIPGTSIMPFRTSDKQLVMGIMLDGEIPAELLAKEVPAEKVANSTEILDLYEDKMIWSNLITKKALEGRTLKVGMGLDPFSLKDFDGNVWDNSRIAGKVTVFNVWYSGCGPCLKEMPIISEWKNEFPDVNFLSVDYEKKEKMQQITERRNFTWTHLYGDRYFTSWVTTNSEDTGFPLTIVVDKGGTIRYVVHGTNEEKRSAIVEAIKKCL